MSVIQALPLAVFFIALKVFPPDAPTDWQMPFLISGTAAFGATIFLMVKKQRVNRICLGINLYLFSGCLAFLTRQWWLNSLYDELRATGVLIWVALVGLVSTVSPPGGFIGEAHPDRHLVRNYSCMLMVSTVAAAVLSYGYRGNRLFSEVIPFAAVFIFHGILKNKLSGAADGQRKG